MAINEDVMLKAVNSSDGTTRLQHEERYQTILENMQEGYYEVDLAGNHNFFNDALCNILRFTREELQGRSYRSYMDDETSLRVYKAFNKVYKSGKPLPSYEYDITRGDGEAATIELSVKLMYDEQGEPSGFQGIIRDITERKLAEEQLKQANEALEKRVSERTAELASANETLQEQIDERKKIEQVLERRNAFLETLNILSHEAALQHDFDTILHSCVKVVVETFQATSAYISAWDMDAGISTVVAEFISPEASEKEKVSDKGFVYSIEEDFGKLAESIENLEYKPYILHVNDPDTPASSKTHFEEYGNKTELGIPLVGQGKVMGLLEIWDSRSERSFSDEDIEFVVLVARQIGTIFNNNRLYQQANEEIVERREVEKRLEERNQVLEIINNLSQKASLETEYTVILQNYLDILGESLQATSAYIAIWDLEELTATVVAEYFGPNVGEKEHVSDLGFVYSLDKDFGLTHDSIESLGEGPLISYIDDPDLPEKEKTHFVEYDNKTELAFPLVAQGRPIGMLLAWDSSQKKEYTEEELYLGKLIAHQTTTLLDNNRLYQKAQEEISERRQAEEILKTLNEIASETYSELDLNAIFKRVVEFTGRFIGATSAYISRIDMDARTVTVSAEYFGPDATDDEKLSDLGETYSIDSDFSTSARLIDTGQEYYVNHIDDEKLKESEKGHMVAYGAKSIINFLMVAKERPIAVLEFWDSRRKREFSEEEIGLIRSVTNQVSRAIENAELYEEVTKELQERRQAEAALRESQEVFRVLTESAHATIYLCYNEPTFPMVYINDAVEQLTGYPKEDFLENGRTISSLFHPDDSVLPEDERILEEEGTFRSLYRIKHRSGEWRWVEDFGAGVMDEDGNLMYLAGFMNDVTDRKQLEDHVKDSLERRSREVRLSAQVAREIAAAADLNDLYRRIVTQVKEQFNFYHVQLLRFDPLLDAVRLIAGYGQVGLKMVVEGHQMPMGIGLIGSAAATGVSYLQPDVTQDPNWKPNPLLPETKAELAVPIKLGNEVLGVLDIQSDQIGGLTEEAQLALEGLCGQLAVAIESTRLRQEMNERLKELSKLQQLMSREGWRSFQARHDAENKGYYFDQSSTHPLSFRNPLEGNNPITPAPDAFKTNELRQVVTSPLTVRGESIGTLAIQDEDNQPLTNEDRELLESISIQVAEALESARLLEQTQKNAVDMETVAQVGAAASTILETQELLQTVVELTQERFGLYFVSIFALNEEQTALKWVAGTRLPNPPEDPMTTPIVELNVEKSLIAAAGRSKKPVVANNVFDDSRFLPIDVLPNTRSEMVMPLLVGEELLGIMDLQSSVHNRFGEDDVRIQTTLAAQVAIAWKNALLYAEQLETAKRLREVDRLKSEFMASMSHELRTPLNSIIGFSDVLLEGIDGHLNERMVEDVTLIRDSGRHLRELISEILDMSKIEAGMMDLRYDVVDVSQVAKEIVASTRSLAYSKDIELYLEIDSNLPRIEADRTRLVQILLNLMSNAIKFTNKGSVSLTISDEGDNICFAVEDTGIGILEEDIPIIFEQFRQIDGSLTRKAGGTGLGMPISKSLVELHGGEMMVQSQPEVGSIFSFTIPKKRPPENKRKTGPLPETNEV